MGSKINSREVLYTFLARAYWFETKMEQTINWYAYLEVKSDEAKKMLFQITSDSDRHKHIYLNLFENLPDFNLEKTLSELALEGKQYKFQNKIDDEIFQEIYLSEKKAYDQMKLLRDTTDEKLIKEIWKGNNPDDYFSILDNLIEEEQYHVKLVEPFSLGTLQRIS